MSKAALVKYLITFFEATIPPTNHSYYEKLETTKARYQDIAETVAQASMEQPLFADDTNGIKTAAMLGSIATYESFLRADIDTCARGGDKDKKGNWTAWTLWQMHLPKEKVCASRLAAARYAREIVRSSFSICKEYDLMDRLAVYTDGVCKKNWNRSRHRMWRAMNWIKTHPFSTEGENNETVRDVLEDTHSANGNYIYPCDSRDYNRYLGICYISPAHHCSD